MRDDRIDDSAAVVTTANHSDLERGAAGSVLHFCAAAREHRWKLCVVYSPPWGHAVDGDAGHSHSHSRGLGYSIDALVWLLLWLWLPLLPLCNTSVDNCDPADEAQYSTHNLESSPKLAI